MRAEPAVKAETMALIEQVQAGDSKAAEALLLRFGPLIASTVARFRHYLPPGAVSEDDLWQEARHHFIELLHGFRRESRSAVGTYFKKMLGWRVGNYVRAERHRARLAAPLEPTHLDKLWHEMRPNLEGGLENPRLRSALRQLSPKQRSVIFRLYWQDKAAIDVARGEGTSLQAITALRRRAESRLKRSLQFPNDGQGCGKDEQPH